MTHVAMTGSTGAIERVRRRFLTGLFELDREETLGARLRYQLLELFWLGWAVYWAWTWGAFIRLIPEVVAPRGLAQHVDLSFFVGGELPLLNAALISACAVGVLFRFAPRASCTLLVLLLHVQYVARHCLGKVAHGSQHVGIGLVLLTLALWYLPQAGAQRRFVLGATRFFMGAGYMLAAFSKLAARGLEWPDGRHLWLWIGEKGVDQLSDLGRVDLNVLQRLCVEHWVLATAFLALGLLTELGGFLLWFPSTRGLASVALIGLHLGIYATMNILFEAYIIQLCLVGLPLERWFDALHREPRPQSGRRRGVDRRETRPAEAQVRARQAAEMPR